MRRRRLRRIAARPSARIRSGSTRWSAKFCASFPISPSTPTTSTVSENGRYRIPNDNPFVVDAGRAQGNLGVRFPQSASAALGRRSGEPGEQPADRQHRSACTRGKRCNIVHKGANYGYSQREGNSCCSPTTRPAPLPDVDKIPVLVSDTVTNGTIVPTYPVIQYGARARRRRRDRQRIPLQRQGDPGAARQVRLHRHLDRADLVRRLQRDARGRRWRSEDDGGASTNIRIGWEKQVYDTMFPIALTAYHAARRQEPDASRPRARVGRGTRRRQPRGGRGRRALCLHEKRRHDPRPDRGPLSSRATRALFCSP